MKCAHCEAPRAKYRWQLQACADGRKKRSKWLCRQCDIRLNEMVLDFFRDPKAAEKVATYVAGMPAEVVA